MILLTVKLYKTNLFLMTMRILGLIGSPRKGSNTDILVSKILEGASSNGQNTKKVYLYEENISPCLDCRECQKGSFQCNVKDAMQKLYPLLEEAEILVIGTPLYWYGASAKMKLLIDRLRPFIGSHKLKGKKAILVIPSEEGADACNHAVGMFNESFKYLGVDVDTVLLPKAYERAEIKEHPVIIEEALEIGKKQK
jgi:multimeric flavodoxin WrbA